MSLYRYLIILGFSTFLCWVAWFSVIFFISPDQAGWLGFVFFYLSLTFALIGSFALIGFLLRSLFQKEEMVYKHMRIASRQSILFALLIIITLILQSQRLLTWWNLLILIAVAAFVELFFISYKKFNK